MFVRAKRWFASRKFKNRHCSDNSRIVMLKNCWQMNIVVLARDMWVAKHEGKERLELSSNLRYLGPKYVAFYGFVQEEAQSTTADPLSYLTSIIYGSSCSAALSVPRFADCWSDHLDRHSIRMKRCSSYSHLISNVTLLDATSTLWLFSLSVIHQSCIRISLLRCCVSAFDSTMPSPNWQRKHYATQFQKTI